MGKAVVIAMTENEVEVQGAKPMENNPLSSTFANYILYKSLVRP
jgi:hypothetical protein